MTTQRQKSIIEKLKKEAIEKAKQEHKAEMILSKNKDEKTIVLLTGNIADMLLTLQKQSSTIDERIKTATVAKQDITNRFVSIASAFLQGAGYEVKHGTELNFDHEKGELSF